jgi:hypothetical protein
MTSSGFMVCGVIPSFIVPLAFPIRTDCVTIFLDVVAKGGTVRWNWHITPDFCLAASWLHDFGALI